MAFDIACATISIQAAGGSGSWREWHYSVMDADTVADLTKPGYFDGLGDHLTPGSVVTAVAKRFVCQLALTKVDGHWIAVEMGRADFPADSAQPLLQGLPVGSRAQGGQGVTSTGGLAEPEPPTKDRRTR
jgi:hypothetical protein